MQRPSVSEKQKVACISHQPLDSTANEEGFWEVKSINTPAFMRYIRSNTRSGSLGKIPGAAASKGHGEVC